MHGHSHGRFHRHGNGGPFPDLADLSDPRWPELALDPVVPSVVDATPNLAARQEPSKSCNPEERVCGPLPTVTNTGLIVGLCTAIPIALAMIALLVLHRRHVKKQRLEDAMDKHKSLDFGLGDGYDYTGNSKRNKKKGGMPEMSGTEKHTNRGRGMSMDLLGSPYLLPAAVHGSRDSIHSMSRSIKDSHDPYRPVFGIDNGPYHSAKVRPDNASTFTGSSGGTESTAHLMRNAQTMPHSVPQLPQPVHQSGGLAPPSADPARDSYFDKNARAIRASNNYLGNFIHSREQSLVDPTIAGPTVNEQQLPTPPPEAHAPPMDSGLAALNFEQDMSDLYPTGPTPASPPQEYQQPQQANEIPVVPEPAPQDGLSQSIPRKGLPSNPRPGRGQSLEANNHKTASVASSVSDYGDAFKVTAATPPRVSIEGPPNDDSQYDQATRSTLLPVEEHRNEGLTVQDMGFDPRRLSMGIRPLPELEENIENPEERANRIRSFYKEYFDDSKPIPPNHYYEEMPMPPYPPAQYQQQQAAPYQGGPDYYEDYGSEYYAEGHNQYEPDFRGRPVAPYAQPMARRAMTPPPRGPPSSFNPRSGRSSAASVGNRYHQLPPRGMSSLSGRMPPPRRALPPPKPLNSLPTPAKITEDNLVFTPTDFAPPTSFRERQAGRRPDSPLGVERPYSPSVRPYTPLASSFDDLHVMPSPHMLRKSGTFTALDFAPPPRFRNGDNMSDSGSIRSVRSGISAAGLSTIRSGPAVGKIPREVVGTKGDFMRELRPQWDMRGPA